LELLERALLADPDSEQRAVRIAQLYGDAGRTVDAIRALERAAAVLAELGVEPSVEHRRVRAALTND
jgi:DNA-binding SARP family transcriptional activator